MPEKESIEECGGYFFIEWLLQTGRNMECVHSGLDIFESPGLQTSILEGEYMEYRPVASLDDSGGPIEFVLKGGSHYIDLANTYLRVKAKVVQPGGRDLAPNAPVVPMNLTLHSMFSDVTLFLNNVQVNSTSGAYGYQAYLQTLLSYSPEVKRTQMEAAMFYADTAGHMDDVAGDDNKGMVKRKERAAESKSMDLMGRLHCDLFHQGKYLLSHLDMRIKLTRAKDSFVLSCAPEGAGAAAVRVQYKLHLEDAALFVRRVTVSPVIALAHEKTLEKTNAVYPIVKTVMRVFTASAGALFFQEDHLFMDRVPNKLVIGFVKAAAYNGALGLNPYNFEHCDLNFIRLYHNGTSIPGKGLRPNYEDGQYTDAYMSLFTGTNSAWTDVTCGIRLEDYPRGYTLYAFDLSPSLAHSHAAVEVGHAGPVRLECQFKDGLAHPMNVVVYAEIDSQVRVTKAREVLTL